VLEAFLGEEFAEDAILSCDGWSAYPAYHLKLQRCWSHLLREAEFLAERYREAQRFCEELHELHDELTTFDEGDPSVSAREQKRADAMLNLEGLIRQEYGYEEVQQFITKIRNGLGHWLTFVTEPEVDSTNNRAERALREQVVMRKIFRSLRSDEGVRFTKRSRLCWQHGVGVVLIRQSSCNQCWVGENSHHRERHLYRQDSDLLSNYFRRPCRVKSTNRAEVTDR